MWQSRTGRAPSGRLGRGGLTPSSSVGVLLQAGHTAVLDTDDVRECGVQRRAATAALADVAARYEHAATDEWQEPIGLGPGGEVPTDGAPPVTTHVICTAMFAPHSEWHAGGQEGEASGGRYESRQRRGPDRPTSHPELATASTLTLSVGYNMGHTVAK
jgi:hypothetical protein